MKEEHAKKDLSYMAAMGNKPSIRVLAERWQVKPSQVEEWLVKWPIEKVKEQS